MWLQKIIRLRPRTRGFHLVTEEFLAQLPELRQLDVGLASFFVQHTSASLTVNENADPSVRRDFETYLNRAIPDGASYFTHTIEGGDDMPAHVKASFLGSSVTIPIGQGRLLLGTWQGIYLGEHRDNGGSRCVIATLQGE